MNLRNIIGFLVVLVIAISVTTDIVPSIVSLINGQSIEVAEGSDGSDESLTGAMMVRIEDEMADYAGIEVLNLNETQFFPEARAFVKVVDLRPLLALQSRHNQALSALNVAKVAEHAAAQEMKRLISLTKGAGSVAAKNVNYAEASWHGAKAKLQGLRFDVKAIHDETIQSWGDEISTWVLSANSKQWQRLLAHQDSLLLVTLPVGLSLAEDVSFIRVARDNDREKARKAYFVSLAVIGGQAIQGESYFFKTANNKLRSGMRLDAWIPQGNDALNGVFIPKKAMVWYAGQPWMYVQVEDDLYQRRSLQSGLMAAGGRFMQQDINAGESVVIRGAQMLLSEEFRWQIMDEDDD